MASSSMFSTTKRSPRMYFTSLTKASCSGRVVGAVEGLGDRVLVGGCRLDIGIRRKKGGELQDTRFELAVAGACGIADEGAGGDAAGAFFAVANGDAEDLVAIDADGGVHLKSIPRTPWGSGTSKLMEPSEAKSSGPMELPSGLVPKPSFLAVSSLTAVRRATLRPGGWSSLASVGGLRACTGVPRRHCRWAARGDLAASIGTGRLCPAHRRGDIRWLGSARESTGFPGALGLSDATLRKSLAGPVVGGPAPTPPPRASKAVEVEAVGGFGFEGGVVEDERAHRRRLAGDTSPLAEQPTGPGGEEFLELFAAGYARPAMAAGSAPAGAGSLRQRATISDDG